MHLGLKKGFINFVSIDLNSACSVIEDPAQVVGIAPERDLENFGSATNVSGTMLNCGSVPNLY